MATSSLLKTIVLTLAAARDPDALRPDARGRVLSWIEPAHRLTVCGAGPLWRRLLVNMLLRLSKV
jgi:hypothetical protein